MKPGRSFNAHFRLEGEEEPQDAKAAPEVNVDNMDDSLVVPATGEG